MKIKNPENSIAVRLSLSKPMRGDKFLINHLRQAQADSIY